MQENQIFEYTAEIIREQTGIGIYHARIDRVYLARIDELLAQRVAELVRYRLASLSVFGFGHWFLSKYLILSVLV
jgi:hypothetical protein